MTAGESGTSCQFSVAELFELWMALNRTLGETPAGQAAEAETLRRINEIERVIGRIPSRTVSEIVLKARVMQAFRELRSDDVQSLAEGIPEDLSVLARFGDAEDLPGRPSPRP